MGGYGSGQWRLAKKTTVEESLTLDASKLVRDGSVTDDGQTVGLLRWCSSEETVASASIRSAALDRDRIELTLSYRVGGEDGGPVTMSVMLEATTMAVGGRRWWMRCLCGHRVAKLYLPPGKMRFGCRHCHDLTYRSAQEHDKRVDAFKRNPEDLMLALRKHIPSVAAMKAALA